MTRFATGLRTATLLAAITVGAAACTDPYSPTQRAVGGGLLGAAGGAAIGGAFGGGRGAAIGAGLGAATGAVAGAATTPTPPRQPYYGQPRGYSPQQQPYYRY
jgi:hypothetical protein